jgi:hypothetical protein
MSAGFLPDDDLRDERTEANDPVWSLLARAPLPEPDGWFAARTLARCRLGSPARHWEPGRLWRWALGTGLGVCLAMFAITRVHDETTVAAHQQNVQAAFEIVASMGDDSDSTSDSSSSTPDSWQDSSL